MAILVLLGLSVLELGPMYATDRRQTSDAHHRLMPPTIGAGHNNAVDRDVQQAMWEMPTLM